MDKLLPHDILEFDNAKWMVTSGGTSIIKVTNDATQWKMYQLGGSEKKTVTVWGSDKKNYSTPREGYTWEHRKTTIWITAI